MPQIELVAFLVVLVCFVAPTLLFCLVLVLGVRAASQERSNEETTIHSRAAVDNYLVIIPAKDEEVVIEETLSILKKQMGASGSVVVVADNCSDATAQIVRSLGFHAIERNSETEVGKGFAIQYALDTIDLSEISTVVVLDADSSFTHSGLRILVNKSQQSGQVVQASYIMRARENSKAEASLSEFFWYLKNHLRPLGLSVLRSSCQLYGSGMAFPTALLSQFSFATSSIVEDREMTHKLLINGYSIIFEPTSSVVSYFPTSENSMETQRERWETGHLSSIARNFVALKTLLNVLRFRENILTTVDSMFPPTIFWLITLFICGVFSLIIGWYLILSSYLILIATIFLTIAYCMSQTNIMQLDITALITIFRLLPKRLALYRKTFGKPETKWVKTKRD